MTDLSLHFFSDRGAWSLTVDGDTQSLENMPAAKMETIETTLSVALCKLLKTQ